MKLQSVQLKLPLQKETAAVCQIFSVPCSKTPLLNTGLTCLTSIVKYAQVNATKSSVGCVIDLFKKITLILYFR